jgi:ClpX C4-type zinc finger protein
MPQTAAQKRPLVDTAEWRQLRCSFCGKDADHVRFLVAGVAGGMICDRCNLTSLGIFLKARLASALRR